MTFCIRYVPSVSFNTVKLDFILLNAAHVRSLTVVVAGYSPIAVLMLVAGLWTALVE